MGKERKYEYTITALANRGLTETIKLTATEAEAAAQVREFFARGVRLKYGADHSQYQPVTAVDVRRQ